MRRSAFEATTRAFHQALRTDDAEGLFSHVAEDVLLMPPGEPAVHGRSAMQAWYAGFLSLYRTSSLVISDPEVFMADDWAVELGTYEWSLTPAGGGELMVDRGNYVQLWQRQPDERWLFARELWNSSTPASSA